MSRVSINKVFLAGNVGSIKQISTKADKEMCVMSIATRTYQGGESTNPNDKFITDWHNVVIYNKYFIEQSKKIQTGDTVLIIGELKNNQWKDATGVTHKNSQIVITEYRGEMKILERKRTPEDGNGFVTGTNTSTNNSSTEISDDLERFFSSENEE
jgi:single-strand DNA-binding protein